MYRLLWDVDVIGGCRRLLWDVEFIMGCTGKKRLLSTPGRRSALLMSAFLVIIIFYVHLQVHHKCLFVQVL